MARPKVLWCVAAIVLGVVTLASAQDDGSAKEDGVEIGLTADIFSKYVWRGQNVIDDWVLQPGASVGYQGLTGSIWGNLDLAGEIVGAGQLTEVDFTLDYSNKVPGLETIGYSVGTIYYSFLNTHSHPTAEVYGGLDLDVPLSPAVRWFYDFDQIEGSYIQLSIGHTIEKIQRWRDDCYCDIQLGASLGYGTDGYNNGYFGVDEGAWNDLTLTAGLPICIGKLTIKPSIGYSTMLDQDLRDAIDHRDNFWGGVGLAYDF
jgi:hypothetical protein